MSYEKYYPGGWQSGESGGTPITPEALNHMENGIANSAPAGYGYGEQLRYVSVATESALETELDSLLSLLTDRQSMQISVNCGDFGIPYVRIGILKKISADYAVFTTSGFVSDSGVSTFHKIKFNRVWQPIEWENPPMVAGAEYRTTERYQGKPVYYQLVSAGNLPNATTRTVNTTELTNPIYYILSVHGRTTIQNRTIPQGKYISVCGGYGNITLETTADYADDRAELVVKYYKPYE